MLLVQVPFGGGRQAIMQAENERNKNMAMDKAIGAGYSTAYDNAMKAQLAQAAGYNQAGQTYGQLGSTYGQLGAAAGQLGTGQQASDIDRLKTQGAYGDLQRGVQQQQLDTQYQDLMSKLNYPITNLETMNNLARGVPLTQTGQSASNTTPPPSFASQLAGMGLSGLSLYGMYGGFK